MNTLKKVLSGTVVAGGLLVASVTVPTSASAHVAPPVGTATCTNSAVWAASGSATVSLAGKDQVKDTITATVGTVAQSPLSSVAESDGQIYTYTISGIPIGTTSVTVTSTLTWGSVDKPSTYIKTTVIDEPRSGCVVPKQECKSSTYASTNTPSTHPDWSTEDAAPTYSAAGLVYDDSVATAPKINYFHQLGTHVVPLAGISGLSYKISETGGPQAAYDMEVDTTGTSGYTTLVWEPYNNGHVLGSPTVSDNSTYTALENGKWWSSHIATGPGSQSDPITLAAFDVIYLNANIISYGVSEHNAGSISTVNDITFLCGVSTFGLDKTVTPSPTPTPSTSTPVVPTTTPPVVTTSSTPLAFTGANSGTPLALGISALVLGLLALGGAAGYRRLGGKRH